MYQVLWIDCRKENWESIRESKPTNVFIHFLECSRQVMDVYMKESYDLVVVGENFSQKSGESLIFDIKLQNPRQEILYVTNGVSDLDVPPSFGIRIYQDVKNFEKAFFCGLHCKYRTVCRYACANKQAKAVNEVCRLLHTA